MRRSQILVTALSVLAVASMGAFPTLAETSGTAAKRPELPSNVSVLSAIGERAVFSGDSTRVAFVDREFGNAYEIELATGHVRNLTGHLPHVGITRVQYLANGDYLITAPRFEGPDARWRSELWVLDKNLKTPLQPLGVQAFEGVAVSRIANRIAWVSTSEHFQFPTRGPNNYYGFPAPTDDDEMFIETAEIAMQAGKPVLLNRKTAASAKSSKCYMESQDFYANDSRLVYSCYEVAEQYGPATRMPVLSLDLASGKTTVIRDVRSETNEPEGVFPDGSAVLTECRELGSEKPLELCKVGLTENSKDYSRLTHFTDTSDFGASNGVISPDGKYMAFQLARKGGLPGQGFGLLLMRLK